jgi:large subunit ribosomal protein L13e
MTSTKPRVFKEEGKQRSGRGFSREELKKAGSNMKEALRLGLLVDPRRKTAHDENVEAVKARMSEKKPAPKPEESKKLEKPEKTGKKAKTRKPKKAREKTQRLNRSY